MSRLERARNLLASAGLMPGKIHHGHTPEINRILDETTCVTCGNPVGTEARGSAQCKPCILGEIAFDEACERTRLRELGMVGPLLVLVVPRAAEEVASHA